MKNKLLYISLILSILLILIYFLNNNYNNIINYFIDKYTNRADTCFVTDTVKTIDTLTFFKEKPIEKKVFVTKIDTFYTKDGNDTIFQTENKHYIDTLCVQNDTAIIQNYISGINANLDSTKIQLRKTKEVITNTIEIVKYVTPKKKFIDHFKVGVGIGYGYGIKNKDIEPFAGISLNYNF